ncbi:TlpA disulfide reductase family protein [uncultured Anaerococcus sp.]|uniref:TlpA disulfide reductase family protein n=1 Tax=uncultured Anaerococcus sp. TaxID=293428 RepID=UPI0025E136D7|nr:TlpA disulfide reductase family protein [uncultured Anaerococcus sp.]
MKNKSKMILTLMMAASLAACGQKDAKEEAKTKEDVAQEAISQAEMPEGAQITTDTETPIEMPEVEGEKPNTLGNFEAKDQDGKKFTNEDFKNYDATVINLWFTGCSACIQEMPELNKVADDLKKDDKVNFLTLCTDAEYDESTMAAYKRIIDGNKPTYQALGVKNEGEIKKYLDHVFAYPTTIVVDKNGEIIGDDVVGAITPEDQLAKLKNNIEKAKESSNK